MDAEKEGIVVPLTLEDYCIKTQVKSSTQEPQVCNRLPYSNGPKPSLPYESTKVANLDEFA